MICLWGQVCIQSRWSWARDSQDCSPCSYGSHSWSYSVSHRHRLHRPNRYPQHCFLDLVRSFVSRGFGRLITKEYLYGYVQVLLSLLQWEFPLHCSIKYQESRFFLLWASQLPSWPRKMQWGGRAKIFKRMAPVKIVRSTCWCHKKVC